MNQTRPKFVVLGRKRKGGHRHPGGQLVDEKPIEPKVIAFTQPHRQSVPEGLRHDPKAETHLGRYQLRGVITVYEYEAGKWYAGVVNRYRTLIDAPKPDAKSNAGVMLGGGGSRTEIDDDEAARRKAAYNTAVELLMDVGQRSAKAVKDTAIYDKPCLDLIPMRHGLIALAVHRGMLTASQGLDIRRQLGYRNTR